MNSFAHLVAGFLAACLASLAITSFQLQQALALLSSANAVAVVALASTVADVDHKKSKVFKTVLIVAVAASAFVVFSAAQALVSEVISRALAAAASGAVVGAAVYVLKPRHRGATHTLLAALAFAAVVLVLLQSEAVALLAFVAYASHLLADGGVKLK